MMVLGVQTRYGMPSGGQHIVADAIDAMVKEPPASLYLLVGPEALLVDRARERVVAALRVECLPEAFNVAAWRATDQGALDAVSTARTLPMLARRRLVVVRDLEAASDELLGRLLDYVNAPSDTTSLVLTGTGFPKVNKGGRAWGQLITKAVKANGHVWKLTPQDVRPERFAVEHAAELGHRLALEDARFLVALVGQELGRVARELEKAALLVPPGAPITHAAIEEGCSLLAEAMVWDLTAGIAGRQPERSLAALHRLMADGEAPHKLLSLIVWQLRTVLRVAELARRGLSDAQIQEELRVRADLYFKIRRQLERGYPGAASVLERLSRANRAMNSSPAGAERVLEQLVMELSLG
jgi:DNA polymerase-3 subunit delta